jgi:hypothetical protein
MLTHVALLSVLGAAPGAAAPGIRPFDRPKVEVWTNRGENPFAAGQAVRVSFQTDQDAYVTLLRVDTDGRVRMLFPRQPWEDNFARGGRVFEVSGATGSTAFFADDDPGEGYLFAVASAEPFRYGPITSDERWDYDLIADGGRVRGDPYTALTDLAERIVAPGGGDWDYDIAPYYVQRHYDYPRFLCYDCHTTVSYRAWNPYDYSCVRFRIVVYDDPYYYPYRSYGGGRVVFTRPYRPEPRFIFKDRTLSDAFVTRIPQRPVNDDRRRDIGVRGRDLGRPGTVPPPRVIEPRRGGGLWGARPSQPERAAAPRAERAPEAPRRTDQPERRAPARPGRQSRPEVAPQSRPPREARPEPRAAPRAEPRREAPRDAPKRGEPELRRRRS